LPGHSHVNYTASFSIFTGSDGVERFKCHGVCGAHGDVIDLAGYLWVLGYNPKDPKDIAAAISALETRNDFVFPASKTKKEPTLDPLMWKECLPISDAARAYARQRGLTDDTIDVFLLGSVEGYLTVPTFVNGVLMTMKKRSITAKGKKLRFLCVTGSKTALFNHDAVAYITGPVFYVKAEIPAMLLTQLGYKACAPSTGEGSWDPEWKTILAFADVVVVGDNDEAGVKAARQRAKDLNAVLKFPPPGYDIDAWILAEPELALPALKEWSR